MKHVLTIAGSDTCGGAGIQADIKTFSALGTYGMSVITAVTVQNTQGVFDCQDITPEIIKKQIDAIFTDIEVSAVKIGMVSKIETIKAIAEKLKQYKVYSTKIVKIEKAKEDTPKVEVIQERESDPKEIMIGSDVIVNGVLHRDSYGKGAGQSRNNYKGKVNLINKKGSHPYHVTTPEGAWLGWVTEGSVKGV